MRFLKAAAAVSLFFSQACLEPPGVGQAAAPDKAESRAPVMGGSTNAEFQKKLEILEGLIDGKLSPADVKKRVEKDFGDLPENERQERVKLLNEALTGLPSDIANGKAMERGPKRDMVIARFHFSERRFIEAAQVFSAILDAKPDFPEARNLLARCFFFLGNPDRTIQELEFRLGQLDRAKLDRTLTESEALEYLESLFLVGAAVLESPGTSRANLERGLKAWELYVEIAPDSPQVPRVQEGLVEIRAGLNGEGRLAQAQTMRQSAAMSAPQGVKGGAASFNGPGGGASGPAAKPADRLKNLPKDASPIDVAIAGLLDGLDMRDPAMAEKFIVDAEALRPSEPVVRVGRARLMVQTGQIPEALQLFGEIIRNAPDYMPAWHYNGMAHMMSGDPGQAADSWLEIEKRDPKYFADNNLAPRVEVAKRAAGK